MFLFFSQYILQADTITITFQSTKTDEKNVAITHHRSNKDLCPVIAWGMLVLRILGYPGIDINAQVNTVIIGGYITLVKSVDILLHIQATVHIIGHQVLGFKKNVCGTHSIRSSMAMHMYLDKFPVYTIMLQGGWSSDAFLLYIHRQVQQFSSRLSSGMVQKEIFFTVPDTTPLSLDDPRTRNVNSIATAPVQNGPDVWQTAAMQPAFHLWG